jgi:hypothetical protein
VATVTDEVPLPFPLPFPSPVLLSSCPPSPPLAHSLQVTHLLFGGENIDQEEFVQVKERNIHIVNEYFLRLLIKY